MSIGEAVALLMLVVAAISLGLSIGSRLKK